MHVLYVNSQAFSKRFLHIRSLIYVWCWVNLDSVLLSTKLVDLFGQFYLIVSLNSIEFHNDLRQSTLFAELLLSYHLWGS